MANGHTQRDLVRSVVLGTWSPGEEFSLDDLCGAYFEEFSSLYPNNGNVRSKFRQLLQHIRDEGLILFLNEDGRGGWYRRVEVPLVAKPASRVEALIASEQVSLQGDDAFDPSNVEDARVRTARSIALRAGQPLFRTALIHAYAGRCCISGCDAEPALEAAHILPYRGRHTNAVTNGLLLRADLHALFDRGHLAIEPTTMAVALAPPLRSTVYGDLSGTAVRLPEDPRSHPDRKALVMRYRSSNVCLSSPAEPVRV